MASGAKARPTTDATFHASVITVLAKARGAAEEASEKLYQAAKSRPGGLFGLMGSARIGIEGMSLRLQRSLNALSYLEEWEDNYVLNRDLYNVGNGSLRANQAAADAAAVVLNLHLPDDGNFVVHARPY